MSYGWENHEPAPLEFMHGLMMNYFHEYRRNKVGQETISVPMSGSEMNEIIAKAKTETYAKYPKQVNSDAILKTDL